MEKGLSEITREEWIAIRWIEITAVGDDDRKFVDSFRRTPDEAAQAAKDWDSTINERNF